LGFIIAGTGSEGRGTQNLANLSSSLVCLLDYTALSDRFVSVFAEKVTGFGRRPRGKSGIDAPGESINHVNWPVQGVRTTGHAAIELCPRW
jgi:hypothetical protein